MLKPGRVKRGGGGVGVKKLTLAGIREDFANTGCGETGETLMPSGFKTTDFPEGNREEQLEIFAIAESVFKGGIGFPGGGGDWDGVGMDLGATG